MPALLRSAAALQNPASAGVILPVTKGLRSVDFFDEDDEQAERPARRQERSVAPPGAGPSRRGGGGGGHAGPPPNRQQARVRQVAFLLGAIVILILIVIAIRGCLDARKDRGFQNYVSDLSSITATDKQISDRLFEILGGGGDRASQDIGLQNEVQSAAGSAQDLLDRAQDLDAPDEIAGAQEQVVLAFELRHDALSGIAAQLGKAGGDDSGQAEQAIYTQMKVLSASDILYARAQDQIEQVLADQQITVDEGVPDSQFLPDDPNYLDPAVTADAVAGAGVSSGGTSTAECQDDGETHGLGLVDGGSSLQPSGTALVAGGSVTASPDDDSIDVQVQNQGTADESGVEVTVSGDGIDGNDTIDSIAAGATATASVPIKGQAGQTVELTVEVTPVPCEQVEENNTATYSVTF